MNPNDKNVFDKFLDKYEEVTNNTPTKVRVYQRPSKIKCILNFILSIAIFLGLIFFVGIYLNIFYFLILLLDILFGAFYGYNLFSEKGIGVPTYVNQYNDEEYDDKNDY